MTVKFGKFSVIEFSGSPDALNVTNVFTGFTSYEDAIIWAETVKQLVWYDVSKVTEIKR